MPPKRPAAAKAESSSAASSSSHSASSSDEERPQEETDRLVSASPKKKNPATPKNPTNPPAPAPAPAPAPQVPKPSQNPPAAAAATSSDDDDDEEDDEDDGSKSDEEEEEEEGSSDEGSDSEDEKTKNQPSGPQSKQQLQLLPKPTPEPSDSGSSDDSDSDSSDQAPVPASRPSRAVDPSIKPISTKPMDAPPKPSKLSASPPPSQDQESVKKRKYDSTERSEQDNQGGQKRPLFQRVWSLDDEIVLLNGLVKYHIKEGTVPSSTHDKEGFRDFIKGSLQMEVSNTQLVDKVRRLKKKFEVNTARAKHGADPKFTKPHEQTVYELSKKVWGISSKDADNGDSSDSEDNEESESEMVSDRKSKEEQLALCEHYTPMINEGKDKLQLRYPYLWETVTKMADAYMGGVAIKRALMMLSNSKAKLMEEKLKKLKTIEMRHHLRRIDLNKETVKLILDAVARSE